MRTISPGLKQALVDGKRATLVKISTTDGSVYGYTDHDLPLTVSGVVYKPSPGLQRISLTASANDSVSNQEFASAWVDAPESELLSGKFDNAQIEVSFCAWDDLSLGTLVVDQGRIGVIQWTADGFRADVQSHMRELQRNINFVQTATCRHQLYGTAANDKIGFCGVNKASYEVSGSVTAVVVDNIKINGNAGLTQPDGWFANGVLTWTSGNNIGLKSEVKGFTQVGKVIEFFLPTAYAINTGDTFTIAAGCDKTFATCKAKFNNAPNFGGFPHLQTEIQYR